MITITADAHQEKINILDREIILNGSPTNLRGNIQFLNKQTETLRVKSIGLTDKKAKGVKSDTLKLSFRIRPGEEISKSIYYQLPINTPAGTYQKYITLGEEIFPVKIIVQPTIRISLYPNQFTFLGTAPGTEHKIQLTLENLGNIPFTIPTLRHASMLDMDLMCRAFGTGFRDDKDTGVHYTLDLVTENIKSNMVDWVSIRVEEAGQTVESGESQLLNILFTIPKNADANRDYSGNFRFWDQEIGVSIKSQVDKKIER